MAKFIITWNTGYGASHEIVEADTPVLANDIAYERWREEAENNADYSAEPYTKEMAAILDLEEPEDEP